MKVQTLRVQNENIDKKNAMDCSMHDNLWTFVTSADNKFVAQSYVVALWVGHQLIVLFLLPQLTHIFLFQIQLLQVW